VKGLEPLSHRRRVFVWTTILVAGTAWAVVFLGFALKASHDAARDTACSSNLRQLARGMLLYADDHDGRLPPTDRWVDVSPVFDKYRRPENMGCPFYWRNGFGYAMSARMSGVLAAGAADPANAPIVFDYDVAGFNASGDPGKLPVPPRHGGDELFGGRPPYNNVVYADGHAQSLLDKDARR
jgi:prepilin-type processing-associated H-X9-DG protein